MADNALQSLTDLLDRDNGERLPADVRASVGLALARLLIRDGELDQAATVLDSVLPDDADDDCAIAKQRVGVARKRAEELHRKKQWSDALSAWESVLDHTPVDVNAYLRLAHAHTMLAEPIRALNTYLRLVDAVPTGRSYLTVAPRLQQLSELLPAAPKARQIRIALLGNATLDQLTSFLTVECYRVGLRPTMYQAGYDQVVQEIMNPDSGLYRFAADIVICAIHASRLFPCIHRDPFDLSIDERRAEIESGLSTVTQLMDILTERTPATVLLHNTVVPQHPTLGIADLREEFGQTELFAEINRGLADLARTRYQTVYIVDEDRVQARAGKARATDSRLWLAARVPWAESVHLGLAREYIRYLRPLRGLTRKCVVLDLDNTLWGGVVGEDGLQGIQLGVEAPGNAFVAFQRELEALWRRGILLAVASKNNYEDVAPVFEQHQSMVLRWSHIAAHRINWRSKPQNLRELAAELNIGLDSLVFLDDNPIERAAVRAELPDVLVPELPVDPAEYRATLLELDVFESLGLTNEDRQRGKLYAEQAERRAFEASTGNSSLEHYLEQLDMQVEINSVDAANLTRIAQLTNKTNQFNLTTRRYTEAQILELQDAGSAVYSMRLCDRFGDNGLVGVAILSPSTDSVREVDTLLLSCRVMGRGVEAALVGHLADRARSGGADRLRGRYIPTSKNAPARDCYASLGFSLVAENDDGSQVWDLDLRNDNIEVPRWLRVTDADCPPTRTPDQLAGVL